MGTPLQAAASKGALLHASPVTVQTSSSALNRGSSLTSLTLPLTCLTKLTVCRSTIRKASELTDSTIAEASQRLEHSSRRADMEASWSRSSGGYSRYCLLPVEVYMRHLLNRWSYV